LPSAASVRHAKDAHRSGSASVRPRRWAARGYPNVNASFPASGRTAQNESVLAGPAFARSGEVPAPKRTVYILKSQSDPARYYTGITADLRARRIRWHERNLGAPASKGEHPAPGPVPLPVPPSGDRGGLVISAVPTARS